MVIVFIAINLLRVTFILYSGFHVFVKLEQAFYTVFCTIASCAETGVLAKGGVLYPTFSIDDDDMILYMEFEDEVSDKLIKFDEQTGELYLNVG